MELRPSVGKAFEFANAGPGRFQERSAEPGALVDPMPYFTRAILDDHPRVRLEALVALSFVETAAAAETFNPRRATSQA